MFLNTLQDCPFYLSLINREAKFWTDGQPQSGFRHSSALRTVHAILCTYKCIMDALTKIHEMPEER